MGDVHRRKRRSPPGNGSLVRGYLGGGGDRLPALVLLDERVELVLTRLHALDDRLHLLHPVLQVLLDFKPLGQILEPP